MKSEEPRDPQLSGTELGALYGARFEAVAAKRDTLWRVLTTEFLAPYIPKDATVVDVGAATGDFLRYVDAKRRIAVDYGDHVSAAADWAEVVKADARDLAPLEDDSAGVILISNLLEHMPTKADVLEVLRASNRVLEPGGILISLHPNLAATGPKYWDYFDHITPLTPASLTEGLELAGFEITRVIPRFLPYTVKGRIPVSEWAIRAYLKFPPAWWVMGQQMLHLAAKTR